MQKSIVLTKKQTSILGNIFLPYYKPANKSEITKDNDLYRVLNSTLDEVKKEEEAITKKVKNQDLELTKNLNFKEITSVQRNELDGKRKIMQDSANAEIKKVYDVKVTLIFKREALSYLSTSFEKGIEKAIEKDKKEEKNARGETILILTRDAKEEIEEIDLAIKEAKDVEEDAKKKLPEPSKTKLKENEEKQEDKNE